MQFLKLVDRFGSRRWAGVLLVAAVGFLAWRRNSQNTEDASKPPPQVEQRDRQMRSGTTATFQADRRSSPQRKPLQFRAKTVEPAAVLDVLATGPATVEERVRHLKAMRGISLSDDERESAWQFLSGQQVPASMTKSSLDWLADELLTVMRMQTPPDDGLAGALGKAAFQPQTDPVVRDYIMQHLGHLWEQAGPRKEIDAALWQATKVADEMTPGTALIALKRGYERDRDAKGLGRVRSQALTLAKDIGVPLAVRVTALSIAGEEDGDELRKLAKRLASDPATPVILRTVAERLIK